MPVLSLKLKRKAAKRVASRGRLSPYTRGIVYGMHLAGATLADIASTVAKPDGKKVAKQGAGYCIELCERNGGLSWNGCLDSAAGRPRETTAAMDRELTKLVLKHRGTVKVTVESVKQVLPAWRKFGRATIERRLGEAGLAWLGCAEGKSVWSQRSTSQTESSGLTGSSACRTAR